MLNNFISPYESTATNCLRDEGAINIGKLNMVSFKIYS